MSMQVLDYSGTGSTLNGSLTGASNTYAPSASVPTLVTSDRTLNILCGSIQSISYSWIPGVLGNLPASLRSVSGSTLANASDGLCEDSVTLAASNVSGFALFEGTGAGASTSASLAAFNY